MMLKVVCLLRAYVNSVLYTFAVNDNNSTDVAYPRGPSAAAKLLVEQTNTLKHVKLQEQLRHTTEELSRTKEELNETRQRLSDVQKRLTVAEQVTAATQQRALQESDTSEQLELAQHEPTTPTGFSWQIQNVINTDEICRNNIGLHTIHTL